MLEYLLSIIQQLLHIYKLITLPKLVSNPWAYVILHLGLPKCSLLTGVSHCVQLKWLFSKGEKVGEIGLC